MIPGTSHKLKTSNAFMIMHCMLHTVQASTTARIIIIIIIILLVSFWHKNLIMNL